MRLLILQEPSGVKLNLDSALNYNKQIIHVLTAVRPEENVIISI